MGGYFGVAIALIAIFGIPILFYLEYIRDEKEAKRIKEEFEKRLATEMQKPKYVAQFVVNGKILSSRPLDPEKSVWFYSIITSAEIADQYIRQCYDKGYFESKDGKTYPVRRIESAWAAVEPKNKRKS